MSIVPITSACNLDCPICYTHNKNEGAYHMGEDELRAVLGHLRRADPERRIINLTGGEPTLHPDVVRLVELCAEEGIHRITLSTHGLRFLKDDDFLTTTVEGDSVFNCAGGAGAATLITGLLTALGMIVVMRRRRA